MIRDSFRRFLADATALVLFSTALGVFIEIGISRLTLEQSLRVRLSAAPISLLAGRPYGLYRNWLFHRLKVSEQTRFKAAAVDTLASVTFQLPLYAALLAFGGARPHQIAAALLSAGVLNLLTGRPFGVFLMWCRRRFGVRSD